MEIEVSDQILLPESHNDNGEVKASVPSSSDRFDVSRLRLSQDFASSVGVKKALVTVPVKKPEKDWFVRVHPAEEYRLQTAVLEIKSEREVYHVERELWPSLSAESTFGGRFLFTAVNRQGVVFLWPVKLPRPDGRSDEWNRSLLEAAEMATRGWIRVVANMHLGAYEVFEATGDLPEPVWPEMSFGELLKIAFKDHFIDSMDHPVLKRLRGEL
jgi:hypothetical protein